MRLRIWGARGSLPTPGAEMLRYGGNTSCVQVTLSDGTHVVLDAGTGIRNLPADLGAPHGHIHVLLSHLHLDHIQGLLFFEPLFNAESEVTIWGPSAPAHSLQSRIGRYLSARIRADPISHSVTGQLRKSSWHGSSRTSTGVSGAER
jgi:phosphoribosyl 1,2-cyclic phosphodiesterase